MRSRCACLALCLSVLLTASAEAQVAGGDARLFLDTDLVSFERSRAGISLWL